MRALHEARADFPILETQIGGKPLVYLDNAATTQKPSQVLHASRHYYEAVNSNIHRGTHLLARQATEAHEAARVTIARHLKVTDEREIIFTSGCTESINLVASALGRSGSIQAGDEIIISALEHHSNIVPWQMLAKRHEASLKVIPCDEQGVLDLDAYRSLLNEKTRIVAVNHVSNAFGTLNPIKEIITAAKAAGAYVLIDGAQSIPHFEIDLSTLGADFYTFSGHKIYAPTGIGILWGRHEILESLAPWKGGGEMIKEVTYESSSYNDLPFRFEAGTPNIEGAIALGAAFDYLNDLGLPQIAAHEQALVQQTAAELSEIDGVQLYGPHDRVGAVSFNIKGIHHYDLGTLIDQMGVAVRTGHHCCQPLMGRFGITGTVRASFALYNHEEDVKRFIEATQKALMMLR